MESHSKNIPACSETKEASCVAGEATFEQPALIHVFIVALSILHLFQTIADAAARELD
jgi:hypothetical protein